MANVVNLFSTAKEVILAQAEKKSSAAKEGVEVVEMGDDLTALASVRMLIKALGELADLHDAKVKERMANEFARMAAEKGVRPDSFKGVSDKAEASCQLRRRASSSFLNQKEIDVLSAMEIPVEDRVICEAVPERFFFNPDLVVDEVLAERISRALSTIPELDGKDILFKQAAVEADVRKVVPDEALDAVAAIRDVELIKELLPIVSTMAIRVKLTTPQVEEALSILKRVEK